LFVCLCVVVDKSLKEDIYREHETSFTLFLVPSS